MDTNIINKVVNEYLNGCLDCKFDDTAIIHIPDSIDGIRAVTHGLNGLMRIARHLDSLISFI